MVYVLATQRDEPVRHVIRIPVNEGQTAVGHVLAQTITGVERELSLLKCRLVGEAIEDGYDACCNEGATPA